MDTQPPDFGDVCTGLIPWDVDECIDLLMFHQSLSETPKDDWDLDERRVTADLSLNMFAPMNQIGMYATRRIQGDHQQHHLWRFFQIGRFLERNEAELIDAGLCRYADGCREFARSLIHALCHLRLTEPTDIENVFTFNLADVISEADRLSRDE